MKAKVAILIILVLLLAAEIGLLVVMDSTESTKVDITMQATEVMVTEPAETLPAMETMPVETAMPTETIAPTEPPVTEPPVTEPKEKHYTLTFAGDCTFGSISKNWNNGNHWRELRLSLRQRA